MSSQDAPSARAAEGVTSTDEPVTATLRLALVGWMVAGIRTHYENVSHVVAARPDVAATRVEIHPWRDGGNIERLPLLPHRVRSTLRTYWETAPLYRAHPVDVVWSQIVAPALPFLFTSAARRHIPVVLDVDSTPRLLASFGEHYAEQVAGPTLKRRAVDALVRAAAGRSAAIVCWSEWAARSYVADYGAPRERVRVIPPGVNVEAWAPPAERPPRGDRLRLLFVGGDFARKGGDLLIDVWRHHFADQCELHIVTRSDVWQRPGVIVYREYRPNDPGLRALYHRCDALVLPSYGDCFSLASIEAMAAGLPVITTTVGGIPEIIDHGATGYLIPPHDGSALRTAIAQLVADESRRTAMGAAARNAATDRFDATQNTQRLLHLLREVAGQHQ